ncbi:hypothetical protein QBC47DRAFT_429764 [Echria macrotheca]|uniref:Uncharacterized protein n=1 Tax=Echria macrotheca TaxID=438768 RepID=A0AAJ0B9I1_9PEZI|nr:hypothetical protein QBC47DRAFT_429764 [Echria macrotheca]
MAALLLSWDSRLSDLVEVKGEISQLQKVLEESFGFSATSPSISDAEATPKYSLEEHLMKFRKTYDGVGNLMVIYYGGHAIVKDHALHWIESKKGQYEINWSDQQSHVLAQTEADVLVILDCCYAGAAMRANYKGRKEILAACSRESEAIAWRLEGSPTFTAKLIEKLATMKDSRFPIQSLAVELSLDKSLQYQPNFIPLSDPQDPIVISAKPAGEATLPPYYESSYLASISLHFSEDPETIKDKLIKYLSTNFPQGANWVRVENIQRSASTLVTLSVPMELWAFLPDKSTYSFLGLVKGTNFLLDTDVFKSAEYP